jgi:hypothetical protein
MIRRGEIDGVLFGRNWRVDHDSLDEYVRRTSERTGARARHHPSRTL